MLFILQRIEIKKYCLVQKWDFYSIFLEKVLAYSDSILLCKISKFIDTPV